MIASTYDAIVTPYHAAFLDGPNTTDITLQDQCATDATDHDPPSRSIRRCT